MELEKLGFRVSYFNKEQLDFMQELEAIPPKERCYCGWYRVGECPHCPAGKTCADKLLDRGNAVPSSVCVDTAEKPMMAGIAIDDWKLSVFERHLSAAGYAYTTHPGLTSDTVLLKVATENPKALEVVVRAANDEAAHTGKQ